MSTLTALGPLLDPSALLSITRQLWSARERLNLRTGGNLPSAPELAIALRMYTVESDRRRQASLLQEDPRYAIPQRLPLRANSAPVTPALTSELSNALTTRSSEMAMSTTQLLPQQRPPNIDMLLFFLRVANVAYAQSAESQAEKLHALQLPPPLQFRLTSSKWSPGYFLVHSPLDRALLLVIRGSKEISDLITNMSAEMEPFLTGHGHQGIIKSAHNLYDRVKPLLYEHIQRVRAKRVVLVGHSLGAAVAAALTMLLRRNSLDVNLTPIVKSALRRSKCISFSPPPFLSPSLAERSQVEYDITTVVLNLDVVPRLSAASLDRLLYKLSRYDWGGRMINTLSDGFRTVATGVLPESTVANVSNNLSLSGSTGMQIASTAITHSARAALSRTRGGALWKLALNATAFMGELMNEGLDSSRRRQRHENGFAREFGMGPEDVERALADGPRQVALAGNIWVIDRQFTDPRERGAVETVERGAVPMKLRRGERKEFEEVQVSGWMIYDHHPESMMHALKRIERQIQGESQLSTAL